MVITSKDRLLTVLNGGIPDCVPVSPDFSNMIPARLTGRPFWDLYLYNDPPIWEAHIECVKHFDIDGFSDGFFPLTFPDEIKDGIDWQTAIVFKSKERIVTQRFYKTHTGRIWEPKVNIYYVADSPTSGVDPEKIGLPREPDDYELSKDPMPVDTSPEGFKRVKGLMGDSGLVGVVLASSAVLYSQEMIYDYFDDPQKYEDTARRRMEDMERRFANIMAMEVKPDFLCVGSSGTLIFQSLEIFRKLAFPTVKKAIELADEAGILTHVHSCGPEKAMVKIFAEETSLTVIDPLEIPPMGDCDLAEIKRLYGDKIVLKGNLHTTNVMRYGSVEDVIAASKKAIDDAAEGGRFILSTGDQCGRDTPDENIHAMVQTARDYGRY
ncbi:MAG: uroporphyrinogen decarboxylase family protein [Planctomycetota bacterium]